MRKSPPRWPSVAASAKGGLTTSASSVAAKIGLGFAAWGFFSAALAGPLGFSARGWKEGEVSPCTVYAPFHLTYSDQGRDAEIQRGELVVFRGEKLKPSHVARLNALTRARVRTGHRAHWAGAGLLSLLFVGAAALYLRQYEPRLWQAPSHLALAAAAPILVLTLAQGILQSPVLPAWIPVALAPMLLSMLFTPRLGIFMGLLSTGLLSLMIPVNLPLWVGFGIGSFVAAAAVRGMRRRIDFLRAGFFTGSVQAAGVIGGHLLMHWSPPEALAQSAAALGSGILSALITFSLLPLCESVFGLITQVSLLELSDLNHPLLKELSVKAPGTYHHSLIVANLAEAACEKVGANALLARVGCYFHDIGKMLHPEYFVENQPPEISRHERLAPSMSSLVILNHVKDGIRLARRHRLNEAIIDFIPGHHGTGLIYYFYRKALEEVEDEKLLKEERFRYPGPKPHTRETAVALLADSVEAASRAQKEKTPARLEEGVRRIINNKFIDGQLDHCELTLRDLHRISEAFLRVLTGIYHSRIEYPKAPGEEEGPAAGTIAIG
ncbi:MAG: HDIG domain-containing protein [Candidatus Omnitrophica bacterium]|nr:HDIG domain-containing protein [Candidatus Omnitrophota bacterium]